MMKLTQEQTDALERLDWSVSSYTDDGRVEIGKCSPAGEDFNICVEVNDFPRSVREYAEGFDIDEHVALWIDGRGQRGVPETARELVEDAEAIQQMLNELADALEGKKPPITDQEKQNREELFRLMQQHPDLPVVPMVDAEIVADDCYAWWVGRWGHCELTATYMGREKIHFKDDDEEDVLADMVGCKYYMTQDGRDITDLSDDEWNELYATIPWTPCIAVYITT